MFEKVAEARAVVLTFIDGAGFNPAMDGGDGRGGDALRDDDQAVVELDDATIVAL